MGVEYAYFKFSIDKINKKTGKVEEKDFIRARTEKDAWIKFGETREWCTRNKRWDHDAEYKIVKRETRECVGYSMKRYEPLKEKDLWVQKQ